MTFHGFTRAALDELLPTHRWLVNHLYEGDDIE